jgi:hypothetical protein
MAITDVVKSAAPAAQAQAGAAPAPGGLPTGVKEVQRIAAPGGGFYVLGSDGGVFAIADATGKTPSFYGSVPMTNPQGKRNYTGLELNPTGGYTVTGDDGSRYNFDTNFARANNLNVPEAASTLTSDPAFMAFLRTSGLGLETAANQVRQQTGAINAATQTAMGDIDNTYGEQSRRTAGSYESRGVSRGSSHQQAQDQVERGRITAKTAKNTEAATSIGNLNSSLVNKVLETQGKAAELGLNVGQQQDLDAQIGTLKKKYAPELGGLSI